MRNIYFLILFTLVSLCSFAQYPLVSISNIQEVSEQDLQMGNDDSYYLGDTVQIEGVVMFDPCDYGLSSGPNRIGTWLEEEGNGPWSGIHVLIDPGVLSGYNGTVAQLDQAVKFIDNFKRGLKVRATGIVSQFSGYTQVVLLPVQSTIVSVSPTIPSPKIVQVDSLMQGTGTNQTIQITTGEQWEGVLVELQNVTVVDVSPTTPGAPRYYWYVQDPQGNRVQIRDASGWFRNDGNDTLYCSGNAKPTFDPTQWIGSNLSYIRGFVYEYSSSTTGPGYYLAPRDTNDIGPITAAPPIISGIERSPVVATSSQTVTISAEVEDPDGTVSSVRLFYSYGFGSTNFTSTSMSISSGNTYSAVIPASGTDSTYVNFWMRAIDNNSDTTDYPATNATSLYYLTLDNGINSIKIIQKTPNQNGVSIWDGDSIANMSIHAIVTSSRKSYDLGWVAIQENTTPWSGIFLQGSSAFNLDDLERGDSIEITSGLIQESFGLTTISNVTYNLIRKTNVPSPVTMLNPDSVNASVKAYAEAYEGMFVRFEDVYVVDTNADYSFSGQNFGEFMFDTDTADMIGMRVDDYSNDIPMDFNIDSLSINKYLPYIQGIVYYSFSNYKLLPRNKDDIGGFKTEYPKTIISFGFENLIPKVFCNINEPSLTIDCSVPDTAANFDLTNMVPTIDFEGDSIAPGNQVAMDFSNPVDYTVTAPIDNSSKTYTVTVNVIETGIEDGDKAILHLYPNPTNGTMTIVLAATNEESIEVRLFDMLGKSVASTNHQILSGNNIIQLNLSELNPGIYFIELSGENLHAVKKVKVVK